MKLLEIRNKLKSKKPVFTRHDSHKKSRVKNSGWRRPKGLQNKMRLHKKGYKRGVATGFGSPKEVYGLSREGLTQNVVLHVSDLKNLDPKKDGVIISKKAGARRKKEILEAADKFTILNLDKKGFLESLENKLKAKQDKRKKLLDKREKKKSKKTADKKEELDSPEGSEGKEEGSIEEKKKVEKKEKDKLLTKKE